MSNPMVVIESVSKRYGSKTVVDNVSFAVNEGEIVGFLGPNGAGKTTTLRMIAGYLTPTAGQITVAGYDVAVDNYNAAKALGYLPERPPLYDNLSVANYLRFVAKAKGLARHVLRSEVERVVSACQLGDVYRREIFKLSKGYRQRTGLAQAMLGQPSVLLLDEPTIGLDPGQMHETRESIQRSAEGSAVLLSTHILSEATRICHRVAIIDQGRLLAIDTPDGLERAISDTNIVSLETNAPREGLVDSLMSLDAVQAVRVLTEPDERGHIEVECTISEDADVVPNIARTVSSRWDLTYIERRRPTLENVFLHYLKLQGSDRKAA